MAVILYTGLMGSGKSYSAVENVLIPAIKQGRTIVTNVVLKKEVIFSEFPEANIITLPDQIEYSDRDKYFNLDLYPAGSVFLIDECGELFPSGEKQNLVSQHVKQFFTKHRHSVGSTGYSSEIVLMTQRPDQLASWVRGLVDTQYSHEKLDKHGLKNSYRVDLYNGAHTGSSIPEKFFIKSLTGSYKSDFFKYYKSHTQNKSEFTSGLEEKVDSRGSFFYVYRNAIISLLALPLLIYFAYSALTSVFTPPSDSDSKPVVDDRQFLPVEVDPNSSDPAKPFNPYQTKEMIARVEYIKTLIPAYEEDPLSHLPESETYKLVGTIRGPRGMIAILRSERATYEVNALQFCSYSRPVRDWMCVYNGELIASHTGPVFTDDGTDDDRGIDLPFAD